MQSRTISRELALLVLGQVPENQKLESKISIEDLLSKALDSLMQHWIEGLDDCAQNLELAQEHFSDSELNELEKGSNALAREDLSHCFEKIEKIMNSLSSSLEIPRLLVLSDQDKIRQGAMDRVQLVIKQRANIDSQLDQVMEGWRLKRLPRIDRDILRLAFVDLINLRTPPAVACNEAVELANRYSDDQGRRMINGVLRRLQDSSSITFG